MDRIANFFAGHHRTIATLVVALSTVAVVGAARLTYDDVPRNLFRSNDQSFALMEQVQRDFGADDQLSVFVVESDDFFKPETARRLHDLIRGIRATEGIQRVQSIADVIAFPHEGPPQPLLPAATADPATFERARRLAQHHPLVADQLLSPDGKTTLVIAHIDDRLTALTEFAPVVKNLRHIAQQASVSPPDSDAHLRVRLTGIAPIREEMLSAVNDEHLRITFAGAAICFTVGLLILRRFGALFAVGAAALTGLLWTMGAAGLAGEKLTVVNNVLWNLVIVIGFADAVHLMMHIRHQLAAGRKPHQAVHSAIVIVGPACALTSITTAIGFGSLVLADMDMVQRLGIACACGTVLAFFAVITVVPLLSGTRLADRMLPKRNPIWTRRVTHAFQRIVEWPISRPRTVALIGGLLITVAAVSATRLRPDAKLTEALSGRLPSVQALAHCDRVFGGILSGQILVQWPANQSLASHEVLQTIAKAQTVFDAEPTTPGSLSIVDVLDSLPGDRPATDKLAMLSALPDDLLHRFVRPDLHRALITTHMRNLGGAEYEPILKRIEHKLTALQQHHPGYEFTLTGTNVVAGRNFNRINGELARTLFFASVLIFGVMTAAFRSIRLGLISILPNILPMASIAAALVWVGEPLRLTSVIAFSICLGMAVDDTIHFINRFRYEMQRRASVVEAVRHSFHTVGSAMLVTTLIFMAGCLSTLVSSMPTTHTFGALWAVGMFTALLGDLLFLPAILICFVRPKPKTAISAAPGTLAEFAPPN